MTSALLGIALGEGLIKDVDQKVLGYFADRSIQNVDGKKEALTLRHLLTMTAGFEWSENGSYGNDDSWVRMRQSGSPVQYILDLQMSEEPGSDFYYNTGATHLLSAVLQKVTDKKTHDYAREKLFDPLGVSDVYWSEDGEGISTGGAGIYMAPLDMARFGYLFLKNGRWSDEQVVPEGWVKEAAGKQADTPNGLAGRYGYGYQWWMNSFGGYSARGYGGQYIFVLPEHDIVAVFTSSLPGSDFFLPESLVELFVIPAVKAAGPIPGDAGELQNRLKDIREPPEPRDIRPLPGIAKNISGQSIRFENGTEICLWFTEGGDAISAQFTHGPSNKMLIGLDDVYRISDAGSYWPLPDHNLVAAKGFWADETIFTIKLVSLHEMDELTYDFTFNGTEVNLSFYSQYGGEIMETKGSIE